MIMSGRTFHRILFLFSVAVSIFFIVSCSGSFGNLKDRDDLMDLKNDQASLILADNGELIGKFYTQNRTNISYKQIPKDLIDALISTEDVRFFEHKGNDTRSLFRVLVKTIIMRDRSSGGGSTITEQLAKNICGRKYKNPISLIFYKIREAIVAHRIEKIYSKEEILTMYLNTVPFGENVYGIEAAANRFFSKSASKLKIEESAVLIGMLKANTLYNPHLNPKNAHDRRNVVFRQMEKYKYLSSSVADKLCQIPMVIRYSRDYNTGMTDYFLVQVRNEVEQILDDLGEDYDIEKDGLVITTTLNMQLQKYAAKSLQDHLAVMQKRLEDQYKTPSGKRLLDNLTDKELRRLKLKKRADVKSNQDVFSWDGTHSEIISVRDSLKNSLVLIHAGVIALDPRTGAVKTWIGGIDYRTQPYDQVLARRQLASTFKPVIYAAAIEEGFEPCQYLENDSIKVEGFDDWSPENYDHSYGGEYTLAAALAHSMNVPTFNLFRQVGFNKVNSLWKAMGFSFKPDNTPSLAMGTAEACIREVASAYSSFVNGGFTVSPQCIISIKTADGKALFRNKFDTRSSQIISERTCHLMQAMLQKAVNEGTGATMRSIYGVTLPLAGKTGTSQNYSDAWFTALNPSLVIVTRAGASTPAIHFNSGSNGSGSTLAMPVVAMTLQKVQQNPSLSGKLISDFPALPPELEGALDCPDIREKKSSDDTGIIFKHEKPVQQEPENNEKTQEIRSLIKRIFQKDH
jgi:penicillin-binding protein 1A